MRPTSRRQLSAGFTLVEAMATLTLMAIILPVALRGVSLASAAASLAKRKTVAVALAETKLAELTLSGDWNDSDLSGDFGDDYPDYRWEGEVTTWEDALLLQLEVRVLWPWRGGERSVTLTTLVAAEET